MGTRSHLDYKPFTLQDLSGKAGDARGFVPAFGDLSAAQDEDAGHAEPAVPEAPAFSEAELAAAREDGKREGYSQGKQEAEDGFNHALREQQHSVGLLVSDLMARLDVEAAAIRETQEHQRKEVGTLVLLLAKKLAGNALTAQPLGAVEPMIAECMALLQGQTRLSIAVTPSLVEPLKAYIVGQKREGQAVEVIADERLVPGDCRIQWPGGRAERNHGAIWQEIERIISRTMGISSLDIDGKNV